MYSVLGIGLIINIGFSQPATLGLKDLLSPVDKGALRVHEVELVVKPCPGLHDGCGVGQAADRSLDAGQVAARHHCRRLVVDAHL
jgi:hypothetical protein